MHATRKRKKRRRRGPGRKPMEKPLWDSAFALHTMAAPSPRQGIGFGHAPELMQDPAKTTTTPSTEVPDLDDATVKKIQKAITANDKALALQILLDALALKDPAMFDKSILEGGKLYSKYGSTSDTAQGSAFKTWLASEMAKLKGTKTDEKAVRAHLNTLTVPKGTLKIKVRIAEKAFYSVSQLYSTVRHEFIHVNQIKANPLLYVSSSVWPSGYPNPSERTELNKRELDAYLWEADNLKNTGQINDPYGIWNIREQLGNEGVKGSANITAYSSRWRKALKDLWTLSATGYVKKGEGIITAAGTNPLSAAQLKDLKEVKLYLEGLWREGDYHAKDKTALEPRYQAIVAALFPSVLAEAKTDMAKTSSGYDAYNVWKPLHKAWKGLSATEKTKHETAYKAVMIPLFKKAFSQMETSFWAEVKAKQNTNTYGLGNSMFEMMQRASDCFITGADLKDLKARFAKVRKVVEGP